MFNVTYIKKICCVLSKNLLSDYLVSFDTKYSDNKLKFYIILCIIFLPGFKINRVGS